MRNIFRSTTIMIFLCGMIHNVEAVSEDVYNRKYDTHKTVELSLHKGKTLSEEIKKGLLEMKGEFSALKKPKKRQKSYGIKYENTKGDLEAFEQWVHVETGKLEEKLKPFFERLERVNEKERAKLERMHKGLQVKDPAEVVVVSDLLTEEDYSEIKIIVDSYKKDGTAFSDSIRNKLVWTNGNRFSKVHPPFQNYKQLKEYFQPLLEK